MVIFHVCAGVCSYVGTQNVQVHVHMCVCCVCVCLSVCACAKARGQPHGVVSQEPSTLFFETGSHNGMEVYNGGRLAAQRTNPRQSTCLHPQPQHWGYRYEAHSQLSLSATGVTFMASILLLKHLSSCPCPLFAIFEIKFCWAGFKHPAILLSLPSQC